MEGDALRRSTRGPQVPQAAAGGSPGGLFHNSCKKRGDGTGYDGFRHVLGTKLHAAVDRAGLPAALAAGPANRHESARFVDVIEDAGRTVGSGAREMRSVHADRGYDSKIIRSCLRARNVKDRIPHRRIGGRRDGRSRRDTVRYVVERFFAWMKGGFGRLGMRYEGRSENFLAFANVAAFATHFRVLG